MAPYSRVARSNDACLPGDGGHGAVGQLLRDNEYVTGQRLPAVALQRPSTHHHDDEDDDDDQEDRSSSDVHGLLPSLLVGGSPGRCPARKHRSRAVWPRPRSDQLRQAEQLQQPRRKQRRRRQSKPVGPATRAPRGGGADNRRVNPIRLCGPVDHNAGAQGARPRSDTTVPAGRTPPLVSGAQRRMR